MAHISARAFNDADSEGENVEVIQELMRHSNSRTALDVYSQGKNQSEARDPAVTCGMIMPDDTQIAMKRSGPDERLGLT